MNKENDIIWQLVEDYAKKLPSVDYWSGKVQNSRFLTPAYESRRMLEQSLNNLNSEHSYIWELINNYAKKLQSVDYWSGNVQNSRFLTPAYEAQDNLKLAIEELFQKNTIKVNKKIKYN